MELSALDACEDGKVVRRCRTQASSHNSQGVVDGGVIKAGKGTETPDRSALFCCGMHQGKGGYSQNCCSSNPSRSIQAASKARRVMSASCEMTQGVGDT